MCVLRLDYQDGEVGRLNFWKCWHMRKFVIFLVVITTLFWVSNVDARNGWQGCCSWHGGIAGYCQNGRMVCNDGTLSPSCLCDDPGGGYSYDAYTPRHAWSIHKYPDVSFTKGYWKSYTNDTFRKGMSLETGTKTGLKKDAYFIFDVASWLPPYESSGKIDINRTRYYIRTYLSMPFKYYIQYRESTLSYSIDGGSYIKLDIDEIFFDNDKFITVYFRINNFIDFYHCLLRGNSITFIMKNGVNTESISYSLSGFTYVYNKAIDHLRTLR